MIAVWSSWELVGRGRPPTRRASDASVGRSRLRLACRPARFSAVNQAARRIAPAADVLRRAVRGVCSELAAPTGRRVAWSNRRFRRPAGGALRAVGASASAKGSPARSASAGPRQRRQRLARTAGGKQPLELPQVDELLRLGEGVAGGSGDEHAVAEDPAELRRRGCEATRPRWRAHGRPRAGPPADRRRTAPRA